MKWSFRIAKLWGTEIRVHVTFFLLLLWVGAGYLATSGAGQAVGSVVFICALFACVVLHEFGHAMAARRFGIRTPDITLLPIGGLARLERMPENPRQELIIAVAGPLVNVLIAAVLLAVLGRFPEMRLGFDIADPHSILPNLMLVNLWLVIFNMIPAFPMDGGRVLRAVLAMFINRTRATEIAATIGQSFAIGGGMIGLMGGNPFLILIAVFIFMAAGAEATMARTQGVLEDVPVSAALMAEFRSLPLRSTLRDAIAALLHGSQEDFPVVDDSGGLYGILTRQKLIVELAAHGADHPVSAVELSTPAPVLASDSLFSAFEALQRDACQTLIVVDAEGGKPVGILTLHNVSEVLMVRRAIASRLNKPAAVAQPTRTET